MKARLADLALGLLIVTLAGSAWYYRDRLLPHGDLTLPPIPCEPAQGPCTAPLPDDSQVHLQLAPVPLPTLRPIQLSVRIEGPSASRIRSLTVDLAGADMDMGHQAATLTASAPGQYQGTVTVPVCTTGRMRWQATLLLDDGRGSIAIPFRFWAGDQH